MLEALKLRKIRLREQKSLNENNLCLFKHITSYMQGTSLTSYEREEVLQQIIDMLLQAQIENRDKAFIVGNDYKEFCENIIKEYSDSKSKLYLILNSLGRYLIWLLASITMFIVVNIFNTNEGFSISASQLLFSNYIAIFVAFISETIKKQAINIPIHHKVKFTVNINKDIDKKSSLVLWAVILLVSLLIQTISKESFGIILESYFLGSSIIGGLVLILVTLILCIELYKLSYNKRG